MMLRLLIMVLGVVIGEGYGAASYAQSSLDGDDKSSIIEGSKAEKKLMIYSNMAEYNWRYILQGFKKKYPWIKIHTMDMGPSEGFERYYSEKSVQARTADIIATAAPEAWIRFMDKGELYPYQSPKVDGLPDWSMPFLGLYTVSADPMIIIYNKILLKDQPDTIEYITKMPLKYKNKVTTYSAAAHSFANSIHWGAYKNWGEKAWPIFEALGKVTRLESGGSTMVDKVSAGEYVVGYYVSGITVFPKMKQSGRSKVLGWNLIKDGTPVFLRGMGITKQAKNPNSAKLMVDYIISKEGQIAVGKGGMTPYHDEVMSQDAGNLTYQDIVNEVGKENVIRIEYDREFITEGEIFLRRWKKSYGLGK